jgi:hypothetical protein
MNLNRTQKTKTQNPKGRKRGTKKIRKHMIK